MGAITIQVVTRSHVTPFTIGFDFCFFSVVSLAPTATRVGRAVFDQIDGRYRPQIRYIPTFAYNHPMPAAGGSATTSATGSLISTGANPPPRRRPCGPPRLSETKFPNSRRRHSSNVSMRHVCPTLADSCRSGAPSCGKVSRPDLATSVKVIDLTVGGVRVTLTLTPTASSRAERSPDMQESARFLDLADQVLEWCRPMCCSGQLNTQSGFFVG